MKSLIIFLCTDFLCKDVSNTVHWLSMMISNEIRPSNWNSKQSNLSHGKLQEAEDLLDRMVEKCLISDNINYDNLIKCFCWYGRLNKAVDLMNTMLKK